jgi:Fe-S-cluster-containing dehydrogenase component
VFIFDLERCFGCSGCVAACANANATPPGLFWRRLLKLPPWDGDHHTIYLSIACNHCVNAPCAEACPAGALEKREGDGVVLRHAERCIGCRYCQMACPYDAIRWEAAAGEVSKCNFCHERLEESREPACVETCFSGALTQRIVEIAEGPDEYLKEAPGFRHHSGAEPAIRFIAGEMGRRPERHRPFPPPIPSTGDSSGTESHSKGGK